MWDDPLTWQVTSAIAGVLAVILTILIIAMSRKTKELGYEIMENLPLIKIQRGVEDRIELLFDKKRVTDVSLVLFRIINSGKIPIIRDDFDKPIAITFGDSAKVLEASIEKEEPPNLEVKYSLRNNNMEILPALLNPNDSVTFRLLITQFSHVEINTHIVGVKKIKDLTYRRELYKSFLEGVAKSPSLVEMVRLLLRG
jgi:hypothetical protein